PDAMRRLEALLLMTESAFTFAPAQRQVVEQTIADHCAIRQWHLHAANCRSNHVHVVVTAPGRPIELPREQLKACCTRRLKEREEARTSVLREHWWTERGWDEYIDDEEALANVVAYVRDGQGPRS